MCLHSTYNRQEMEKVMGDNTYYVTILRDPVDVFESQYSYYKLWKHYGMNLEEFARAPKKGNLTIRWSRQGRNQMLYDLGLNHKYFDNAAMVRKKVKEVEEEFDLVMIAEQFDKSLILLKDDLCWGVEDVTSFPLNGRKEDIKTKMSKRTRQLLKKYLKSDYILYNHFLKIFNKKVKEFGKARMNAEVEQLKKANAKLFKSCSMKKTTNRRLKGDQHWYGPGDLIGYKFNNKDDKECALMTMSGLKYIERIREKQTEKANKILKN